MAVNVIRHHGRAIDFEFATESRTSSLLAVAGGVGEIPSLLLVADGHWEPLGMDPRFCGSNWWILFCNGRGWPTFYAVNDDGDFQGGSFDGFCEASSCVSGVACSSLAVWVRNRVCGVVRSLAEDFGGHRE